MIVQLENKRFLFAHQRTDHYPQFEKGFSAYMAIVLINLSSSGSPFGIFRRFSGFQLALRHLRYRPQCSDLSPCHVGLRCW